MIVESLRERRFVMLTYAAGRAHVGKRQSSPHAMLIVIAMHVAVIAAVMSAKMDLPQRIRDRITRVNLIVDPLPPPPNAPTHPQQHQHQLTLIPISDPRPNMRPAQPDPVSLDPGPTIDLWPVAGTGRVVTTGIPNTPVMAPVRRDPKLLTPPSELRPPYPPSKILSEEEGVLQLRLIISDAGRVTAVDPVGAADHEFLDAARRYLIAHWRYQPATEDGRAVTSSTVITLRFQLDG
jgi:protein TonB